MARNNPLDNPMWVGDDILIESQKIRRKRMARRRIFRKRGKICLFILNANSIRKRRLSAARGPGCWETTVALSAPDDEEDEEDEGRRRGTERPGSDSKDSP